jgi:pimeloyl-ACP methyl ester carboxylesterase
VQPSNRPAINGEERHMQPTARAAGPASSIARTVRGPETPSLLTLSPRGAPRAAVVIAHGGQSRSPARDSNLRSPALRMLPFLFDLARSGRRLGLASLQLRYRLVGYNEGDAVADVEWALDRVAERYGVPVCLLGHSMGARAALRAAGHPSVVSVVALAPWCPPAEPVEQLAGRTVVIMHGERDRITDPARSLEFAERAHPVAARLARFELRSTGHTMLQRLPAWQSLARGFTLRTLGLHPIDDQLAAAFALPAGSAVRIRR